MLTVCVLALAVYFLQPRSFKKDATGYKDATYEIGTRYFGYDAFGDLNNDGKEDVVFLLTDDSAGSGRFYYVVAAFKTDTGYVGSNAVLLGDRIAPQGVEIHSADNIIVNYADRLPTEPMTTPAHVGISRYFKIADGKLVEKDTTPDAAVVEAYMRANIKTLAPEKPVLGGSWYVVSVAVDPITKTGAVVYEDGHIQGKAIFSYTRTGETVVVSNIKKQ